jgi:thioredoxin-dependent peroxiredoxin
MTKLSIGDRAPDFSVNNQNGEIVSLKSLKGRKVVLYFYPKDNTPGCTVQACNLRDNYQDLLDAGYAVFGISPDTEKKHQNFIAKFDLPFDLLADTEKEMLEAYGVWGEKKMYGRTYMGVFRTTFVLDENGVIVEIISKVKTKDHSAQIMA